MSRFKIGQEVIALHSWLQCGILKDEHYIVDGFVCCKQCGRPYIYIKNVDVVANTHCSSADDKDGCGYSTKERANFSETAFAPLQNFSDAVEYRLSVSIPELIEVKEYQNQ